MTLDLGRLISRTFSLSWHHKWLWLLGLFGGGSVGYTGFATNFGGKSGRPFDYSQGGVILDRVRDFIPLIIAAIAIILFIAAISFVVSCFAVPATVWAAARLDAGEPVRLAQAFAEGRRFFWVYIRLGLIRLAIGVAMLAVGLVIGLAVLGVYLSTGAGNYLWLILVTVALVLLFIVGSVFFSLVFVWSQRTVVLLGHGAVESIRSSWTLTRGHLVDTIAFALVMGLLVSLVEIPILIGAALLAAPGIVAFVIGIASSNLALMIPGVLWMVLIGGAGLLAGSGFAGSLVQVSYALACRDLCRTDGLIGA